MNKELFFIGKKQLKVPIVQGGMGVVSVLEDLPERLQKKAVPEQFLLLRLVLGNQIFMRIR